MNQISVKTSLVCEHYKKKFRALIIIFRIIGGDSRKAVFIRWKDTIVFDIIWCRTQLTERYYFE